MTTNNRPKSGKPWSKNTPEQVAWDYVIIGSGMGGMTTAAMLAKLGKRVLVLEQHYVPGGFTHMFKRPGYQWDVGVHAVGEVTERSLPGRLLSVLTQGNLKWSTLGPVYDEFHFPGGFRIDFPDSPKQFRQNLIDAFPSEKEAIDNYLEMVRDVASGMRTYYLSRLAPPQVAPLTDLLARKTRHYLEMRTGDVLAKLTGNEKLRAVLAAQWGYYGSVPSRSSFAIHALVVKHFMHGGYYPVGGARRIAETLLETVAGAGGWTRVASDVAEILIEDGRAAGVRLADGEVIRARRVVSAAGALPTLKRLLPASHADAAWGQQIGTLTPAPAHLCLYLGFKGDIRQAGASAANKWFYRTWSTEDDTWHIDREPLPEAPVLYCSFPSLKDPEHDAGPELRHTGEVVTFAPWELFAPHQDTAWKKRSADYEALKAKLTESMLEQFLTHMPHLRPMIDHVELSTPLSTDHFCRPASGSIYGIEPTPERFGNRWLRPRTPIRGLFMSGSDMASVGVIGAMMGGVLCAVAAEPIPALRMLRGAGGRAPATL
jgi:all-trans-retinol 13,14-reductase